MKAHSKETIQTINDVHIVVNHCVLLFAADNTLLASELRGADSCSILLLLGFF